MPENNRLAERFEAHRPLLRAVAGRMLGSTAEADDAVQETWLRLVKSDGVENMESWLRTVVSRISLDMLRSRRARREEPIDWHPPAEVDGPEHEAVLVDEVGRAMLVVLDRLGPAERVALVLHDMFAVPFEEIAPVLGRNAVATKKLASRARQKVRGEGSAGEAGQAGVGAGPAGGVRREVPGEGSAGEGAGLAGRARQKVRGEGSAGEGAGLASGARRKVPGEESAGAPVGLAGRAAQEVGGARPVEVTGQREIVEAFLKASREGDLEALLGVLAPDVVRTADAIALPKGRSTLVRGRDAVAREMLVLGRRARFAEPALIDGEMGAVVAPNGQLRLILAIEIRDGRVAGYEVIAEPSRLESVEITPL